MENEEYTEHGHYAEISHSKGQGPEQNACDQPEQNLSPASEQLPGEGSQLTNQAAVSASLGESINAINLIGSQPTYQAERRQVSARRAALLATRKRRRPCNDCKRHWESCSAARADCCPPEEVLPGRHHQYACRAVSYTHLTLPTICSV